MDHPAYLLALPFLALPWLLKIIFPQIPTLLKYSQMYLLEKVLKQHRSTKKIKLWWLNVLRSAILLTMICVLLGILGQSPPLDPNASQIILLDDSFFAHAHSGDLFEDQRSQAKNLILSMNDQQEVSLLGRSGRHVPWGGPSEILRHLSHWEPSYQKENWNLVRSKITKLHRQRQGTYLGIHLLGPDLSARAQEFSNAMGQLPKNAQIHSHMIHSESLKNIQLFATHWHEGNNTIVSGHVSSSLSKYRLAFTPLKGETLEMEFSGPFTWTLPKIPGKLFLLAKDDLSIDQHYYLTNQSHDQRRVYLLSPQEAPQRLQNTTHYLQKGINQVCQMNNWSLHKLSPLRWQDTMAQAGDILILHNPPSCSEKESQSLERWLERGGDVYLFPGPQTPPDAFDTFTSLPAKILGTSRQSFQVIWPESRFHRCPTFSKTIFKDGFIFKDLHPKAHVRARREDGSPFWISLKTSPDGGSVHLCSSPYHLAWSNATLKSDFIESLNLLLTQTSSDTLPSQLDVTEPLPTIQSLKAILGSSSIESVAPGLVEVTLASGKSSLLAINFSPDHVQPRFHIEVPDTKDLAKTAPTSRQRERLDRLFAFLLAFLLLGEAIFIFMNLRMKRSSHTQNA